MEGTPVRWDVDWKGLRWEGLEGTLEETVIGWVGRPLEETVIGRDFDWKGWIWMVIGRVGRDASWMGRRLERTSLGRVGRDVRRDGDQMGWTSIGRDAGWKRL